MTHYKWKNRYLENRTNGLQHENIKAHNKQSAEVTNVIEKEILDLRIIKRFGLNENRFMLKCGSVKLSIEYKICFVYLLCSTLNFSRFFQLNL